MDRKRIVIVGTNFAGYTAALELKELVGDNHEQADGTNSGACRGFTDLC